MIRKLFYVPEIKLLTIILIGLICIVFTDKVWNKRVVTSDARGYYAFLPSFILEHDITLKKNAQVENAAFEFPQLNIYLKEDKNGNTFNKYTPGTAIFILPFFILGIIASALIGTPITGYTNVFYFILQFSTIFYVLIGLYFMRRIVYYYVQNYRQSWIFTFVFYFGSSLLYYTYNYPLYSHIPSFATFSFLVWNTIKLKDTFEIKYIIYIGIAAALAILIRPVNGLAFFALPMIFANAKEFIQFVKKIFQYKNNLLFAFLFSFCLVLSIGPIIWKLQTGNWFVYTYNGEGFNFLNPHIVDTLFSFRTGVLIHSPFVLIAILSSIYFIKKHTFKIIFFWIYFAILTYVTASWWAWDYAGSFGHRAYLDHFIFLIFPLIFIIKEFNFNKYVVFIMVLVIAYNFLRLEQCRLGITDKTNFSARTFFRSLLYVLPSDQGEFNNSLFCTPYGKVTNTWYLKPTLDTQEVVIFNENKEFGAEFKFTMPIVRKPNRNYGFNIILDKRIDDNTDTLNDVFIVCDGTDTLTDYRDYQACCLYNYRSEGYKEWVFFNFQTFFLDDINKIDNIKFYVWNKGRHNFAVRNIIVEIKEYTF